MIEEIFLNDLKMNHFTEFDAELYCQLSLINPDNIKKLLLNNNKLEDISGISIFKNLEELYLNNNQIKDISPLNNLKHLKKLWISDLNLTDESNAVDILKSLSNLNELDCYNTFKTVDIRKELKRVVIEDD